MEKYRVLRGHKYKLQESVEYYLRMGWELHGGLIATGQTVEYVSDETTGLTINETEFAQALVLIEDAK